MKIKNNYSYLNDLHSDHLKPVQTGFILYLERLNWFEPV